MGTGSLGDLLIWIEAGSWKVWVCAIPNDPCRDQARDYKRQSGFELEASEEMKTRETAGGSGDGFGGHSGRERVQDRENGGPGQHGREAARGRINAAAPQKNAQFFQGTFHPHSRRVLG